MSEKQTITVAQAGELRAAGFPNEEIHETYNVDFSTVGAANVAAKAARPVVQPNTALIAQAAELFEQGREGEPTKKGRLTSVLGQAEGLGDYTIVVYQTPAKA
jgi:hypothetical protein